MLAVVLSSAEAGLRGSSGVGPVVIVVGLTVASALVLTWIVNRLPDWGAGSRWDPLRWGRRRRTNPFGAPPENPDDRPPSGPFER